jgi:hypothetical protein
VGVSGCGSKNKTLEIRIGYDNMQIEKHKLPPPIKKGPNVKRVRHSDWGNICDRYATGDSLENIGRAYGTTPQNILRAISKARWRFWRAVRVVAGDKHAIDHRPIEDEFTPWLEEKVRTNTLTQLEWFLSKLPDVPVKARRVK